VTARPTDEEVARAVRERIGFKAARKQAWKEIGSVSKGTYAYNVFSRQIKRLDRCIAECDQIIGGAAGESAPRPAPPLKATIEGAFMREAKSILPPGLYADIRYKAAESLRMERLRKAVLMPPEVNAGST
jgi:hypothetical protein